MRASFQKNNKVLRQRRHQRPATCPSRFNDAAWRLKGASILWMLNPLHTGLARLTHNTQQTLRIILPGTIYVQRVLSREAKLVIAFTQTL